MRRVGFITGFLLCIGIFIKVMMAAAIFRYPSYHNSLAHHVPFGDPYYYALYLLATALCCALILFGEFRALFFWFMLGGIAFSWQFMYHPGFSPALSLNYLLGPAIIGILIFFRAARGAG